MLFFFFSSRRRHTRSLRDWSSDVCSSDLGRRRPRAAAVQEPLECHAPGRKRLAGLEERRVGKECRSRWSPHHEKKKTNVLTKLTALGLAVVLVLVLGVIAVILI